MGWRFRKSIRIVPGVRLNLGKKSTGISFGGKGFRYSINSKGRRTKSIGIPGTGVYFTESSSKKSKKKAPVKNNCMKSESGEKRMKKFKEIPNKKGCLMLLIPVFIIFVAFFACIGGDEEKDNPTTGNTVFAHRTDETVSEDKNEYITFNETTTNHYEVSVTQEASTYNETTEKITEKLTSHSNETTGEQVVTTQRQERLYVLNTNTMKIHNLECRHVDTIHAENYAETYDFSGAIANGYEPCGTCHPTGD